MTSNCPQCNFPIPREGSRFCNQCGADLRAIYAVLTERNKGGVEAGGEPVKTIETQNKESYKINKPLDEQFDDKLNEQRSKINMAASRDNIDNLNNNSENAKTDRPEATLHVLMRDGSVVERDLVNNETRLGKGPGNDIILSDASVSGAHAMISFADGNYILSDLGSRNGTYLNDTRVVEARKLVHGDLLRMGHCTITFRLREAADTLSVDRTQLLGANPPPPPTPPPSPKPSALTEDALAAALVSSGLVAQSVVGRLRGADARGRRLIRALLEDKHISEIGLRDLMSRTFNIPPVELKTMEIDSAAASSLRPQFLRSKLICPIIGQVNDRLTIAVADPTDRAAIDEVERITNKKASLRIALPSEVVEQVDNYFLPRLVGVTPAGEKIEALLNVHETEIGKAPHNRLKITDPTVSSTHAIVLARDGGYSIVDLGSSNGTFVNGNRLGNEAHTLQHGDQIQLGQVLLAYRNPAETTENKTSRLSLQALEEVRRRAAQNIAAPGTITDPNSWTLTPGQPAAAQAGLDEEEKKKKKKKKDDDRIKAAVVNSTSRILSTVLGAALTIAVAYYITKPSSHQNTTDNSGGGGVIKGKVSDIAKIMPSTAWKDFSTGLFGTAIEASGVSHPPGSNGVLIVSDNREGEVLWMALDEEGKQLGSIKTVPLGISVRDPESITYGSSFFYVVTSQSEPKDGVKNALVRFGFDAQTQTMRGQAEVISDLRSFLLSNITELNALGAPPGVQGGLNIEGIAWDPNNERLLLGLRSPQIGNQAVLVPLMLRDPHGAFTKENIKVDDPRVIVLPLEGHGVRDIHYDSRLRNFLIISGAPENAPRTDFLLWEWDGKSEPIKLMTLDDKSKPEGLTGVTINGRNFLLIVGDAGQYLKLNYADAK